MRDVSGHDWRRNSKPRWRATIQIPWGNSYPIGVRTHEGLIPMKASDPMQTQTPCMGVLNNASNLVRRTAAQVAYMGGVYDRSIALADRLPKTASTLPLVYPAGYR